MRLVSLGLAMALLTGCGAATKTAAQDVAPSPAATSAAPAASSPPPRPATLGATLSRSDKTSAVKATVYSYRQPLASAFPPDRRGYTFAGLDARVCMTHIAAGFDISVSWFPWSLEFADNTVAEPTSAWSDDWFRVPLYPAGDRPIREGGCVRGWIVFEVPKGKHPVRAVYAPDTGSGQSAVPAEWRIGRT
jgi:hypothetical protein